MKRQLEGAQQGEGETPRRRAGGSLAMRGMKHLGDLSAARESKGSSDSTDQAPTDPYAYGTVHGAYLPEGEAAPATSRASRVSDAPGGAWGVPGATSNDWS